MNAGHTSAGIFATIRLSGGRRNGPEGRLS